MVSFVEKVKLTIEAQKQKYRRKGAFNAILSWILLFVTIWGLRQLALKWWPTDLQPQDRISFVIKVSLVIHFSCEIGYFLLYLPGYLGISPYHDRHLINREMKRPWERQNWPELRNKTLKYLFFNSVFLYVVFLMSGLKFSPIKFRFDNFPGVWEIFWQISLVYYIEDIFQYATHRIFHEVGFLYKFHKLHHEYETNWSMVSEYTHPMDYLFANTMPTTITFIFLSSHCHIFIFFFWQIFKLFASKEAHSGYEFHFTPTRIMPFVASSTYHDFHHSKNVGNFAGSVYIWDTFFSDKPTNQLYFDMLTAKQQKQEKERKAATKTN